MRPATSSPKLPNSNEIPQDILKKLNTCLDHCKAKEWEKARPLWRNHIEYINVLPPNRVYLVLHQAAFHGESDIVKELMFDTPGVDILALTRDTETALDVAKQQRHIPVCKLLRDEYINLAKRYIDNHDTEKFESVKLALRAIADSTNYLGINSRVDFQGNVGYMNGLLDEARSSTRIKLVRPDKVTNEEIIPASDGPNVSAIAEYVRLLRPVHRCNIGVFESIINAKTLLSSKQLEELSGNDKQSQEKSIHSMINYNQELTVQKEGPLAPLWTQIYDLVFLMVKNELTQTTIRTAEDLLKQYSKQIQDLRRKVLTIQKNRNDRIHEIITRAALKITGWIRTTNSMKFGLNFSVDKELGSNKHIFSILGPNGFDYYGDVALVLRREIMYHPDFYLTPNAVLFFSASAQQFKYKTYDRRPWALLHQPHHTGSIAKSARPANLPQTSEIYARLDPPVVINENASVNELLQKSKLSPAFSTGWDRLLAREIEAQAKYALCGGREIVEAKLTNVGYDPNIKDLFPSGKMWPIPVRDVTPEKIVEYYMRCEPHTLVECHLPSNASINYIEKIFVKKTQFNGTQKSLKDHVVELLRNEKVLLADGQSLADLVFESDNLFETQVKEFRRFKPDPVQDLLHDFVNINVSDLSGLPAFLPFKVPEQGVMFSLRIKTTNDLRVCFASKKSADEIMKNFPKPVDPNSSTKPFRECLAFVIGCSYNSKSFIRCDQNQFALVESEINNPRVPELIPVEERIDEEDKKKQIIAKLIKYWFAFDKQTGVACWGRGPPPDVICSCPKSDTKPIVQIRFQKTVPPPIEAVGVSTWKQVNTYQNLAVSPCPRICTSCLNNVPIV